MQSVAYLLVLATLVPRVALFKHKRGLDIARLSEHVADTTRAESLDEVARRREGVVLFYMYDELPEITTLCDQKEATEFKTVADWSIHHGLKRHPWRVHHPEKADVFFVPGYFSLLVKSFGNPRPCLKNPEDALKKLARMISESEWYKRNQGKDHLISGHKFYVHPDKLGDFGPLAKNMMMIVDDTQTRGDIPYKRRIVAPYGDLLDHYPMAAAHSFSSRKHSLFFLGQATQVYPLRRFAIQKLSGNIKDSALMAATWYRKPEVGFVDCGNKTDGCSRQFSEDLYMNLLLDSKFGLVIGGDTASTSRLFDFMAAGVIPVIPCQEEFKAHALPFPEDLPWDEFAYFTPCDKFKGDPVGTINSILDQPKHEIQQKLQAVLKYRNALDWVSTSGGSRVPTLVLRQAARSLGIEVPEMDYENLPSVDVRDDWPLLPDKVGGDVGR